MDACLDTAALERAYECIAEAIDRCPAEDEADFLARLALTLAARMPSIDDVIEALRIAESAKPRPPSGPVA